jgi:hypothetical protein
LTAGKIWIVLPNNFLTPPDNLRVENSTKMWYIKDVPEHIEVYPFMALNDDPTDRICGVFVIYPLEPIFRSRLMTGDYFHSSKEASLYLGRQSDVLGKRLRKARAKKDKIAVLNYIQFVTAKDALASDWKRLRFWAQYRLRYVLEKKAAREAKQRARLAKGNGTNLPVAAEEAVARIS